MLVDQFTRECPVIEVDTSLSGEWVVRCWSGSLRNGARRGDHHRQRPRARRESARCVAYRPGVLLDFFAPGKPVENASIESFNGKFRDECLDPHWFSHLADPRRRIEAYRPDYNDVRLHSSLGSLTPAEFAGLHNHSQTSSTAKSGLSQRVA
jgi:putative transposase